MAKKKRKKGKRLRKSEVQRDARRISKRNQLLDERIVDDRRVFRPLYSSPLMDDGRFAEIGTAKRTIKGKPYKSLAFVRQQFINPKRVVVCKRRKLRRQILFRINKIGRGKGGARGLRIMTPDSRIRCS